MSGRCWIAQVNLALPREPLDSPVPAEFVASRRGGLAALQGETAAPSESAATNLGAPSS